MKTLQISTLLIFSIFIHSCKNKKTETIKGSIYIKTIDFGSLYKANKEQIEATKKMVDNYDSLVDNNSEKAFYSYYKVLFDENLEDKPCILIEDKQGAIKRVFFSLENYKSIETLLKDLNRQKEQINLNVNAIKIQDGLYYAKKVFSVEKVQGKTEWSK